MERVDLVRARYTLTHPYRGRVPRRCPIENGTKSQHTLRISTSSSPRGKEGLTDNAGTRMGGGEYASYSQGHGYSNVYRTS